jgi:cation diffusion facilitator CzcD-associated flavoprotein CzcO
LDFKIILIAMKRKTDVLIVGGGPSGMVLSSMLNHFGVNNIILER